MAVVGEKKAFFGIEPLCWALGLARATYYRLQSARASQRTERDHSRALSCEERHTVLGTLSEERFCDQAPAQVYASLLDEGKYLCSERTMYRILAEHHQVRERRDQLRHPRYAAPELLASRPNEVWSWDITKLLGPSKWTYFYLYVILDIFSRYVVGWMVAYRESAELAQRLIQETLRRQGIEPGDLTLHADRDLR
jgi:putative transposase